MATKSAFSALPAPRSLAWAQGRPCVEEPVLAKSVERGNLSVNKPVIRWIYRLGKRCSRSLARIKRMSIVKCMLPFLGRNVDGTMDRRKFLLSAGAVSSGLLIPASASAGVLRAGNNVSITRLGL
jgi:hypothetical protein